MNENKLFVPVSIVVAGLIIAGAVFFTQDKGANNNIAKEDDTQIKVEVDPVTEKDHIIGDINAEIVIVEYSDFECPFCSNFHKTMDQIMTEYSSTGKVAWVYRHFPLDQIHKDARTASEASECVASIGGNDNFWKFAKLSFDNAPTSLSKDNLKANAISLGINEGEYTSCVDSGKFRDLVEENYQSGLKLAKNDKNFGTPYSVVISKKTGAQVTIPGAQSYTVLKQLIDAILAEEPAQN
ncbi:MAG: thioredoxin domain-containing protein [Candidatus Pacebacteria bacterium]|nr:thioredoxin domain-containing protein [Candidatus Paceibacterota bacterium]